ncbi:MAG: energy transducer TonB [Acidobacteria bacterium]|jgi:TonB family protein|nr:energy transducer TonB [Acidobacteriota bacterium]
MKNRILVTVSMLVAFAAPAHAQLRDGRENPLTAARDLYASARYDEALAVLNGLPSDAVASDRKSIEQYRSLCLLALGRGSEAESAIAAVVTADPMFVPGEADASPRVRLAFSEVRQRLLPQIATTRYAAAKAAYDRKDYSAAEAQFRSLLTLLDDPQMGGRLPDLRTLANGFVDLAAAAAAPPPEPKKPEPAVPVAAAPAAPVAPREPHVWTAEEPGVVAPVVIRQDVPRVPTTLSAQARERGLLEVTIDEQGRVTNMTVRLSIHPMYDPQLLAAARDWRYKPATVDGTPVKFRKMIQITVDKR